jgi:nicotinate-nucleotide adenylyltransferase
MRVGLFFGTFNPIHTGHLIIANHVAENCDVDQVWLVVSPQNPFKKSKSLLNEYDRLHLAELAIEDNEKLRASSVEFSLPKPSYTIDTLVYLKEKYPTYTFSLIMGSDNLETLPKWKNGDLILRDYPVIVYLRPGAESPVLPQEADITMLETPLLHISATFIREQLKLGKSCRYLLPGKVLRYIEEAGLYGG